MRPHAGPGVYRNLRRGVVAEKAVVPASWPADEDPPTPGSYRSDLPFAAFEEQFSDANNYQHVVWPMAAPFSYAGTVAREFTQPVNGKYFYPCFPFEAEKEKLRAWELLANILTVKKWRIHGSIGDDNIDVDFFAGGHYTREFVVVPNPEDPLGPGIYEEQVTSYEPEYSARHWFPSVFYWENREGDDDPGRYARVEFQVLYASSAFDDEENKVSWGAPGQSFSGHKTGHETAFLQPHFYLRVLGSKTDDGIAYQGWWDSRAVAIPEELDDAGPTWQNFNWDEIEGVKFLGRSVIGYDTYAWLDESYDKPPLDLKIDAKERWSAGEWESFGG